MTDKHREPRKRADRRWVMVFGLFGALVVTAVAVIWVASPFAGPPDFVKERTREVLATPLFNDPPSGWIERSSGAAGELGDREYVWTDWTAPGTVKDAIKALHATHGDKYTVRQTGPNIERWNHPGTQLEILVSYHTTKTPGQTGVSVSLDVPRELLRAPLPKLPATP